MLPRLPVARLRKNLLVSLVAVSTGDWEADITQGLQMVVQTMERHIAPHPEQWLVARPVWPTDQEGAEELDF
ncbi:MAG TPA: hypothetical protein EYP04_04645 [Anaerolineae bacterium]|nr:hypothetical protein [Anaerolineae bacterium]HIQ04165.1 hypothetical protein [Anaerolineae bacterium]